MMGPESDTLGGRFRKESDTTSGTPTTPTSLRILPESEVHDRGREALKTASSFQQEAESFGKQNTSETHKSGIHDLFSRGLHINDPYNREDGLNQRRQSMIKAPKHTRSRSSTTDSLTHEERSSTVDSSPSRLPQLSQVPSISHSLASLSADSQAPLSSLASSPKSTSYRSFRPSDTSSVDETGSQALASDSESEAEHPHGLPDLQDSAPQLIMPSIKMPSRRPFTDRGRALGRLKVLLAGDSDSGKTSLIKSIVQGCEDIVHIDPFMVPMLSAEQFQRRVRNTRNASPTTATQSITEVHASTKPYPSWWSETETSMLLRRKKSVGDTVLERNLCFVDTPGYSSGISRLDAMDKVLLYMEEQVNRALPGGRAEANLISLLSGQGGSQVDLAFYLTSHSLKHEDIVFLKRLSDLTNVIILLSKSDDRSLEETEALRRSITEQLSEAKIQQFQFSEENSRQSPFTVCSIPSQDDDNMDASLLMSSEYVQPLIPSELGIVIQQVFEKETAACLRHVAATKLVQARSCSPSPPTASAQRAVSHPSPISVSNGQASSSMNLISHKLPGLSPFMQAKLADHTQQEERMAQIRLAKWATDLQRSLQNERQRFEALARNERVGWLNERLHEITKDEPFQEQEKAVKGGRYDSRVSGLIDHRGVLNVNDPLGLLQWNNLMTEKGWLALQVAGGFGILGAMAMWIVRSFPTEHDWAWLRGGDTTLNA